MTGQSTGESPRWDRAAIIEALGQEALSVAYRAAVVKLARETLAEFVDGGEPSPERDKLAGLEGIMNMLHEDLMTSWSNLSDIHATMSLGNDLVEGAA